MEQRGERRPAANVRAKAMPKVYGALFDISLLRDDVHDLGRHRELDPDDEQRILAHLQRLESEALLLIDRFEHHHEIAAH